MDRREGGSSDSNRRIVTLPAPAFTETCRCDLHARGECSGNGGDMNRGGVCECGCHDGYNGRRPPGFKVCKWCSGTGHDPMFPTSPCPDRCRNGESRDK